MRPRSLVAPPRVTVLDALPPRVIAQRLGVPVNTARTHVRRGLERLRGELDPGPGREREAMLAALVPLLGPSSALPTGSRPGSHSLPRKLSLQNALVLATSIAAPGTLGWFLAARNTCGSRAASSRSSGTTSTSVRA